MENYDERFDAFVDEVAPKAGKEEKENIKGGLSGAISLHGIAKIVRHYVELIRKTKNLQLAMVLQMQLPLIERIAVALLDGTEALSNGWPIGDSMGPFAVASMIGDARVREDREGHGRGHAAHSRTQGFHCQGQRPGQPRGQDRQSDSAIVRRNKLAIRLLSRLP